MEHAALLAEKAAALAELQTAETHRAAAHDAHGSAPSTLAVAAAQATLEAATTASRNSDTAVALDAAVALALAADTAAGEIADRLEKFEAQMVRVARVETALNERGLEPLVLYAPVELVDAVGPGPVKALLESRFDDDFADSGADRIEVTRQCEFRFGGYKMGDLEEVDDSAKSVIDVDEIVAKGGRPFLLFEEHEWQTFYDSMTVCGDEVGLRDLGVEDYDSQWASRDVDLIELLDAGYVAAFVERR